MGIIGGVKMTSLASLPDPLLIEAFEKAVNNDLDVQFIELLFTEIKRRRIIICEAKNILVEQ